MVDKAFDDLLRRAAKTAMTTCHARLLELGWSDHEVADEWDAMTARLKAESCKVVSRAAKDFVACVEAKRSRHATTAFLVPFIAVGVRVASEFHEASRKPPVVRRWRRTAEQGNG